MMEDEEDGGLAGREVTTPVLVLIPVVRVVNVNVKL